MGQENFHASVQYGDFKGTAAADRRDHDSISKYLENQGLVNEGEFLVGIEAYSSELMGKAQVTDVSVTALVTKYEGYDDVQAAVDSGNPLKVRKIRFDMPLVDFFSLFKRFEISISSHGMIDQRDIIFDD
ncbi:hypothetical protein M5G20_21690 [Pseudomonas sp. TNT2022 ID1044]|uniref:hypothetical protein n=1 Tax=Pseudomonas sp. TNT2022 ID1044 TaxID=2942636 RepID=UPI00235E4E03|nr:hypothetical protein [Pseudomonas sp. TNT2022 ID1044]MDD0998461.1 hypothetical protein [Pseudomonas sp. TNT2022 ID1044]